MKQLMRHEPFSWEFEDPLSWVFGRSSAHPGGQRVHADTYESPEAYRVITDMPGLTKEEISITMEDGALVITGVRHHNTPEGFKPRNVESVPNQKFARSIYLGEGDAANAEATLQNGVLTVTIPKLPQAQARKITIV